MNRGQSRLDAILSELLQTMWVSLNFKWGARKLTRCLSATERLTRRSVTDARANCQRKSPIPHSRVQVIGSWPRWPFIRKNPRSPERSNVTNWPSLQFEWEGLQDSFSGCGLRTLLLDLQFLRCLVSRSKRRIQGIGADFPFFSLPSEEDYDLPKKVLMNMPASFIDAAVEEANARSADGSDSSGNVGSQAGLLVALARHAIAQ